METSAGLAWSQKIVAQRRRLVSQQRNRVRSKGEFHTTSLHAACVHGTLMKSRTQTGGNENSPQEVGNSPGISPKN
jgi:hypothetical protein